MQGVSIAYTVRGSGRPVLLIHGWQGDHRYMQADVDAVFEAAGGWRRIYLDLPGHGQTPAPPTLSSQKQVMSLLTGAVDALFPDRPFAVAGSSYGGYLTLGLVRSMPERLLGAALLVPDLPAPDGTRAAPAHVTMRRDPAAFADLEPTRSGSLTGWSTRTGAHSSRSATTISPRCGSPTRPSWNGWAPTTSCPASCFAPAFHSTGRA